MSKPWSDFELQCLYDVVNDINWYGAIESLLDGRTEAAARSKMSAIRRECGIIPRFVGPRSTSGRTSYRQQAVDASCKLREACNQLRRAQAVIDANKRLMAAA